MALQYHHHDQSLNQTCHSVSKVVFFLVAVFDDGDEKTLRRTSLCLKGERHFAESEVWSVCNVCNVMCCLCFVACALTCLRGGLSLFLVAFRLFLADRLWTNCPWLTQSTLALLSLERRQTEVEGLHRQCEYLWFLTSWCLTSLWEALLCEC